MARKKTRTVQASSAGSDYDRKAVRRLYGRQSIYPFWRESSTRMTRGFFLGPGCRDCLADLPIPVYRAVSDHDAIPGRS